MVLGRREISVILLAVGALLFYGVFLLSASSNAQTGGGTTNDDEDCPGAEDRFRFTDSGDEQTPPFEIVGDRFLITYEVNADADPDFLFFSIEVVNDENGDVVTSIDQEEPETDSSLVNEGPGEFFLDILASNVEYEVTVEDCTETGDEDFDDDFDDDDFDDEDFDDDDFDDDANEPTRLDLNDQDRNVQDSLRRKEPTDVIRSTIPNKPLPPTGGLPISVVVSGFVLAGAGLLALGLGVRRGRRR